MRGAGFEPAAPEEHRLTLRVFTTRPSARNHVFIFYFCGGIVSNTILTFHIQSGSLSPFSFSEPSRASPPPADTRYDTTCEFARNESRHALDEQSHRSYHNRHIFSMMMNGYLRRLLWVRKYELE